MRFEILATAGFAAFTTRDFATAAGIAVASATRQLSAAVRHGALVRLTRGIWANPTHPDYHPLVCVPKIIGPEQGYVSFLSALHLHGAISQIPRAIQVATTGHGRRLVTPVATYELFQLDPKLMRDGVTWSSTRAPYRIATVEKALVDTLNLSIRRGGRFRSLPEVDLAAVNPKRARRLIALSEDPRAQTAIERRLAALFAG